MKTKIILFFLALLAYACSTGNKTETVYWDPEEPLTEVKTIAVWIPLGDQSLDDLWEKKVKKHFFIACRHSDEGVRWQKWQNGVKKSDDLEKEVRQNNITNYGGGFNYNIILTPPPKDNMWYYCSFPPNRRPNHPGGKPPKKGSPPPPKN